MKFALKPLYQLRKTLLSVAVFASAFSVAGCSFLNDSNPKKVDPPAMKMEDTKCLSNIKETFTSYARGEKSIDEVDHLFDCMIKAVDKFTERVEGRSSKEGYTLAELEQFMVEYFKGSDDITTKLMSIGFEIKSISIGGKQNNLTRKEIERAKQIIVTFKQALRIVDPYKDIILVETDPSIDIAPARIEKAVAALNQFAETMSAEFQKAEGGSALPFSRLFEAYKLFRKPLPNLLEDQREIKKLSDYELLARNVKTILISGSADRIRCEEWGAFIKSAARAYGIYLRYKYGLEDRTIGEGNTVAITAAAANDVLTLLKDAVAKSESGMISSDRIAELLKNYEQVNGSLPKGLHLSSVTPMFPKIFTNVLRPSRIHIFANTSAAEQTRPLGIGDLELRALSYYVKNYIAGLAATHNLFKDRQTLSRSQILGAFNNLLNSLQKSQPKAGTAEDFDWRTRLVVAREFQILFDQNLRALQHLKLNTPNDKADIRAPVVGNRDTDPDFTFDDLIKLNKNRMMVELVLRSFTSDINKARGVVGLTTDEAEALYRGMRSIGFDMGVADPRSQKAGHRTFMEANLFMSNSNGNDLISYREGVEWFDFAMSSGDHAIEVFNGAFDELKNSGKLTPEIMNDQDIFGRTKVDITIFRRHLKENFARYFSNLPGLVRFVEQLKQADELEQDPTKKVHYLNFEIALENASRHVGHTNDKMDSSSVRTLVPILYYIESIYTRFDKNHSGILENDEAWEIFPLMKKTIELVSNGAANAEWKQKMVFSRLLMSGEPPPDDWTKYVVTPKDWIKEKWYKPSVDRQGVVNLISAITTTSRKNTIKAIGKIYDTKKDTIQSEFQNGYVILDELHELSRCSPASLPMFRSVMQKYTSYIFASRKDGKKYDGEAFVFRLQNLIHQHKIVPNKGLSEQCQPLLAL